MQSYLYGHPTTIHPQNPALNKNLILETLVTLKVSIVLRPHGD